MENVGYLLDWRMAVEHGGACGTASFAGLERASGYFCRGNGRWHCRPANVGGHAAIGQTDGCLASASKAFSIIMFRVTARFGVYASPFFWCCYYYPNPEELIDKSYI